MKTKVPLEKPVPDQTVICQLTSPKLQERKQTIIAHLQKQVLEKKELPNGFAYRFTGTDEMLDELTAFIKVERACCGFFSFWLSIQNQEAIWLEITGPKGAKEFITSEMAL